ncbi:hypothetical protein LP420_15235 [Massilia sp. B-10]|nr:hypothetical protein LP420_15235 [Massilia sp. B-10]
MKGFELEGQLAATAVDRISYSLALLDATYRSYTPDAVTSWDGKKLDRSPNTAFTLGYDHSFVFGAARLKA